MNNLEKRHYWIVLFRSWNIDYYDEFSVDLETNTKYINKKIINDCKESVASKLSVSADRILLCGASYLGEMTKDEWEGE